MGFKSIDQLNQSSEVELNPKISILFFDCRGVVDLVQVHWPAQPIIRSWTWSKNKHLIFFFYWRGVADGVRVHQPVRLIIRSWTWSKIKHFIFLAREGWLTGLESIDQPDRSSEVERNRKTSILFLAAEGWQMGFKSINQPSWPPEVECNPKTSI